MVKATDGGGGCPKRRRASYPEARSAVRRTGEQGGGYRYIYIYKYIYTWVLLRCALRTTRVCLLTYIYIYLYVYVCIYIYTVVYVCLIYKSYKWVFPLRTTCGYESGGNFRVRGVKESGKANWSLTWTCSGKGENYSKTGGLLSCGAVFRGRISL